MRRAQFEATLAKVPIDERDAWLDRLWEIDELPEDDPRLPRGCVPYLPCPVAVTLDAVAMADVTANDVFVDVGAGLGRVAALVHLATGARCIGIEIQPALVRAARARAQRLNLDRVRFVAGDAATSMGSVGRATVFFLYCPFGGARLEQFLAGLEAIARVRKLRVCCVGMPVLDRPWLVPLPSSSAELAVYASA
jgi:SAM-dependent methyltransferase